MNNGCSVKQSRDSLFRRNSNIDNIQYIDSSKFITESHNFINFSVMSPRKSEIKKISERNTPLTFPKNSTLYSKNYVEDFKKSKGRDNDNFYCALSPSEEIKNKIDHFTMPYLGKVGISFKNMMYRDKETKSELEIRRYKSSISPTLIKRKISTPNFSHSNLNFNTNKELPSHMSKINSRMSLQVINDKMLSENNFRNSNPLSKISSFNLFVDNKHKNQKCLLNKKNYQTYNPRIEFISSLINFQIIEQMKM